MNTSNIDARFAEAFTQVTQLASPVEELSGQIVERAASHVSQNEPSRRNQTRRNRLRALSLIAAVTILGGTIAVAQAESLRELFGTDESRPANQIKAMQEPDLPLDMTSFQEPATSTEFQDSALKSFVRHSLAASDPGRWGEPLESYARVLLTETGPDGATFELAAMPTTIGNVCLAWAQPDFTNGSTCIEQLDAVSPISVAPVSRQAHVGSAPAFSSMVVFGLTLDRVASVVVHLEDGASEAAAMGKNAYLWRGTTNRAPVSLEAVMTDGTSKSIAMPQAL